MSRPTVRLSSRDNWFSHSRTGSRPPADRQNTRGIGLRLSGIHASLYQKRCTRQAFGCPRPNDGKQATMTRNRRSLLVRAACSRRLPPRPSPAHLPQAIERALESSWLHARCSRHAAQALLPTGFFARYMHDQAAKRRRLPRVRRKTPRCRRKTPLARVSFRHAP